MKDYLDDIIDEYEENMEKINGLEDEDVAACIAKLKFGTFVTGTGGEKYTQQFLEQHYRKSAKLIRKSILSPKE